MEDMLQVGAITSTHGVHGEVKVFPTTDDMKRFSKLKEVILGEGSNAPTLHIIGVKYFKNMVILKFKEYDTCNDVEKLRGEKLYVTRENAVKLQKDEYFIADQKYADLSRRMNFPAYTNEEGIYSLIKAVQELNQRLGEPRCLRDCGIDENEFLKLVKKLIKEKIRIRK